MKHIHLLPVAVALFLPALSNAQDFVNGSFEQNGNLCLINASTTVFNANVKHTHAFGSFRKPDIASNDCGFGEAKDGNWFVGLATNVQGEIRSEAITLELTAPLAKGNDYALSFYARKRSFAPDVQVGVSATDSTEGEVFYTVSSKSIGDDWTQFQIRFTAPANGKYISVRASNPNTNSGVWLDAFKLNSVFVPDNVVMVSNTNTEPDHTAVSNSNVAQQQQVGLYPNPSEGVFKVASDSSGLARITVYDMVGTTVENHVATPEQPVPDRIDLSAQQPGMYFAELVTADGQKLTKRIIVSR
ncbi:MAG TPA: T9SS type A sorting domain-containing protein [Bacteroidia bacterium]|nr:T9SS type A sorting domain-containing protein [Bacteroidia bacterium]